MFKLILSYGFLVFIASTPVRAEEGHGGAAVSAEAAPKDVSTEIYVPNRAKASEDFKQRVMSRKDKPVLVIFSENGCGYCPSAKSNAKSIAAAHAEGMDVEIIELDEKNDEKWTTYAHFFDDPDRPGVVVSTPKLVWVYDGKQLGPAQNERSVAGIKSNLEKRQAMVTRLKAGESRSVVDPADHYQEQMIRIPK